MNFRDEYIIERSNINIGHNDAILMLGSCFSENIGIGLREHLFDVTINPYGISYNPISTATIIDEILDNREIEADHLFFHNNRWNSFMHHSSFSRADKFETLSVMNSSRKKAAAKIEDGKVIFITFGTAYIYEKDGQVVNNCHKIPEKEFTRRLISVDEIVKRWNRTIEKIAAINSDIKIIFTVSPIRHRRDGAHNNNISKSTLLLAIDSLVKEYQSCEYFPAYELMVDDLRDYRFYKDDFAHPSQFAISYIWEKFSDRFFDTKTKEFNREAIKIVKFAKHRELDKQNENRERKEQIIQDRLKTLTTKYHFVNTKERFDTILHKID